MTAPTCSNCNDSGKSPGSNDLDCTHCIAAQERSLLNRWLHTECGYILYEDRVWAIYQRGNASRDAEIAALAEAARTMWGWAIQCGEQFTPGHDEVDKANWRLQCDAALALLKNYPRKA